MGYLSVLPGSSASRRFNLLQDDKINHIYISSGENVDVIKMNEPSKDSGVCDSRAIYIPPSGVRISDLKPGEGQSLCSNGSGDLGYCDSGNQPGTGTCTTGHGVIAAP